MTIRGEIKWDEGPINVKYGGGGGTSLRYLLYGDPVGDPTALPEPIPPDERDDAVLWLIESAPDELYGWWKDECTVSSLVREVKGPGTDNEIVWEGLVTYKDPDRRAPAPLKANEDDDDDKQEVRVSFRSGSGGSKTMLFSRDMVEEQWNENEEYQWAAQRYARLLNLTTSNDDDSGSMFKGEGISVPMGTTEIIVETLQTVASIDRGYLIEATRLAGVGAINKKAWRGFDSGSLQLVNVDATQRVGLSADTGINIEPWRITYTFRFSPTVTAAELNANRPYGMGEGVVPPVDPNDPLPPPRSGEYWSEDKRGFEYLDTLWVDYVIQPTNVVTGFKWTMPKCVRMAIHKIYEEADFAEVLKI